MPLRRAVVYMVAALSLLTFFPVSLQAASIKSFNEKAVLETAEGEKFRLAGIRVAREGLNILPVILSGREVEIETEKKGIPAGTQEAYLYVRTSEIPLPFASPEAAEEKKIMVNELLVSIGAARVLEEGEYKHRERLAAAQEEARRRGEGIWSYSD